MLCCRVNSQAMTAFFPSLLLLLSLSFGLAQAQPLGVQANTSKTEKKTSKSWSLGDVAALAAQRAALPYRPITAAVPPNLKDLSYDDYRDIRFKPDRALWQADQSPIEALFFHVGRSGDSVRIHEVTPTGQRRLRFDALDFDYGKNRFTPDAWGDIGHAGVRLVGHLNSEKHKDELIAFTGASYFRALGKDQRYGLSARGLAVDTVGAGPEEFPRFTDFWLEKPTRGARQATLWALMDSPRLTGAYRFDIKPGDETVVEVQTRIFLRPTDKPIATLGIAPLTSMFFFGENQRAPGAGDFRPEVHDSDGLMIATAEGEWLWRPLKNPSAPLPTSFAMQGLKGFGLMQRDRSFANYEDTEARYEMRPSVWVTPVGDWGPGKVELLQLPTPDETHDNIVAYWVPKRLPQPGESLDFAYRLAWQGADQQRPPNGWAAQSRRGIGWSAATPEARARQVQYVIDFTGPALSALTEDAPVRGIATADSNGEVLESLVYRHPVTGAWRLTLRVQRIDAAKPVELRAFLQHDNHTLSETWTTLITP